MNPRSFGARSHPDAASVTWQRRTARMRRVPRGSDVPQRSLRRRTGDVILSTTLLPPRLPGSAQRDQRARRLHVLIGAGLVVLLVVTLVFVTRPGSTRGAAKPASRARRPSVATTGAGTVTTPSPGGAARPAAIANNPRPVPTTAASGAPCTEVAVRSATIPGSPTPPIDAKAHVDDLRCSGGWAAVTVSDSAGTSIVFLRGDGSQWSGRIDARVAANPRAEDLSRVSQVGVPEAVLRDLFSEVFAAATPTTAGSGRTASAPCTVDALSAGIAADGGEASLAASDPRRLSQPRCSEGFATIESSSIAPGVQYVLRTVDGRWKVLAWGVSLPSPQELGIPPHVYEQIGVQI